MKNPIIDYDKIYTQIKERTYICSICGKIIFPELKINDNNGIDVITTKYSMNDSALNEKLQDNICSDCININKTIVYFLKE